MGKRRVKAVRLYGIRRSTQDLLGTFDQFLAPGKSKRRREATSGSGKYDRRNHVKMGNRTLTNGSAVGLRVVIRSVAWYYHNCFYCDKLATIRETPRSAWPPLRTTSVYSPCPPVGNFNSKLRPFKYFSMPTRYEHQSENHNHTPCAPSGCP